jgi:hypothetical protein
VARETGENCVMRSIRLWGGPRTGEKGDAYRVVSMGKPDLAVDGRIILKK